MKKIFIAEDDQSIQDIIKIILEGEQYITVVTDTGDGIHEKIQTHAPSLILLDIWLSGHDGGKIAKKLKADVSTQHIPVIMISANNETEKIAKEVGANDFLQKPFNIDDLLQIVKKHIK